MEIQISSEAAYTILNTADKDGVPYTFERVTRVGRIRDQHLSLRIKSDDWHGPDLRIDIFKGQTPTLQPMCEFWLENCLSPSGGI